MKIADIITEACWTGYHKEGMKTMFGKRYPNCVKNKKKKVKETVDEQTPFDPSSVTISNSVEDSFRGGYDGTLVAKTPDKQIGYLQYSMYRDVPAIKMVWVVPEFRRYKIARMMLKALQELSPNEEIDWGYTTPDGAKLKQSIDFIKRPNPEIIAKKEKLAAIKSKLVQMNHRLEDLQKKDPELARKYVQSVSDKWNKMHDLEYRLENELSHGKGEYSRLVPETAEDHVDEDTTGRYLSATEKVKNISPVLTKPYGSAKQTALMKNFFGGS